jgi:hypothetical protein
MNRQLAPYLFEIGLSILDSSPWRGGYLSYYRVCCVSHPDVFNTVFFTGVLSFGELERWKHGGEGR